MAAISPVFPTEKSILGLSEDGGWAATKQGGHLKAGDVLSGLLPFEKTFDCDPDTVTISVSPDSQYIASLVKQDSFSVDILHLDSSRIIHRIERIGKGVLEICKLQWSPDSKHLLYFSDQSVFLGIFSIDEFKSRIFKGPKFDDFGRPLFSFSPDGDYFSMIRSDRVCIYGTSENRFWSQIKEYKCDVNCVGLIFAGPTVVVVWNTTGSLRAIAPDGKYLLNERMEPGSNVRAVDVLTTSRLMAVLTQNSKIFIYDTFAWKKLLVFEHRYAVKKQNSRLIVQEPDLLDAPEQMPFHKNYFTDIVDSVGFKEVKNIGDSFKIKNGRRYFVSFSPTGRFLASYDPALPRAVWIWAILENLLLKCLIVLGDSAQEIQGLKWHRRLDRLALIIRGRVIFWTEEQRVFGIYSKRKCGRLKFSWCNTKATIGAIVSQDCGVFVYIPR